MAIKNKWLAQQQLKKAVEIRAAEAQARNFTIQQCKDMMLLAAHDAFGFGEERLKRLSDAYDATFMQYAEMVLSDAAEDKRIWYSKGKVDQELRRVCGKYFVPWEERYGETTGGKDHE